jgi:hypothetical protein
MPNTARIIGRNPADSLIALGCPPGFRDGVTSRIPFEMRYHCRGFIHPGGMGDWSIHWIGGRRCGFAAVVAVGFSAPCWPRFAAARQPSTPKVKGREQPKKDKKSTGPRPPGRVPKVGQAAPEWTADADGKDTSSRSARARSWSWTSTAPPCKAAMPGVQKVHEKYKDKSGRAWDEHLADPRARPVDYMKEQKFTTA